MRITFILLAAATLGLASCEQPLPSHDKAYFTAHPQERAQTLAECRNDPGQLGGTANCTNALQSDADAEHERVFHSAPPPAAGVTNTGHM